MALLDKVHQICLRLSPLGWRELLLEVSGGALDLAASTPQQLRTMLTAALSTVDRTLPGFEDYHPSGDRGIVQGSPAKSLLYHAFASPKVVRDPAGNILRGFPTPTEIETIENLVFGLNPPILQQLVQAHGGRLAVTVFASEYRAVPDCADGAHADLTFSRTGIARVGTARPRYIPEARGYWPEDEDNPHGFRVVPVRLGVWLAAPVSGQQARIMKTPQRVQGDDARTFWVPVHKLFDGAECLAGLTLNLSARLRVFNMKLQRVFASLPNPSVPTGAPFVVEEGLAELLTDSEHGSLTVVPTPQSALVEAAVLNGSPVTYPVPQDPNNGAFATYTTATGNLPDGAEVHPFPAYVHARTKVENGTLVDLNDEDDVGSEVAAGGYDALLYRDMTGEGWVEADVPAALAGKPGIEAGSRPAYVLLSAPDLFPSSGQRELSRWASSTEIPGRFRGQLWGVTPAALCDTRLPANLQLPSNSFDPAEDTMTAVVAIGPPAATPPFARIPDVVRTSSLPDDAAGVFAPGWDVSVDILDPNGANPTPHLAAYGLGSPFPEDAKLCAALSTFWPAVSPDVYRGLSPHTGNSNLRGSVAPLTDDEIGQSGTLPWDGVPGPRVIRDGSRDMIEMASFLHADYVQNALENRFSIRLTSRITAEEYQRRVLVAARTHWILSGGVDVRRTRSQWLFLSFRQIASGDAELQSAQKQAGHVLRGHAYRIAACFVGTGDPTTPVPGDPRLRRMPLQRFNLLFVSPTDPFALRRREADPEFARANAE